MDNLKLLGIEHHGVIGSLRQVGQQFGMAGISVPGEMQRLFIQRRGSDGRDRASSASAVARLMQRNARSPAWAWTSPGRSPAGR